MAKLTGKVTIHNVAKAAGVSISTVSRVINGMDRVMPSTRRKVEAAIRKLKFYPNSRAQALSRKRTNMIGLIVPDFEGDYFTKLMAGAHEEAEASGFYLMVIKAKGTNAKIQTVKRLQFEGRTDGLILMLDELHGKVLEMIGQDNEKPIVILDKDVQYRRFDNILVDNRTGAFDAACHLIYEHGIKRLFFVGGSEDNVDTVARARGFRDAIIHAGVEETDTGIFFADQYSYDEGCRLATQKILPLISPGENYGIVAANDDIACGVIDAMINGGFHVPEQVAVIGFDDSLVAVRRGLKLTTMRIPLREIGRTSIRMIMDRLVNNTSESAKIILKTRLIVRDSCGCVSNKE